MAPLDVTRRQRQRMADAIRPRVVTEADVGDWPEGPVLFVVRCPGMAPWVVCAGRSTAAAAAV